MMETTNCPKCGKMIPLGDCDEVFDTSLNFNLLSGWAFLGFTCPDCGEEFTLDFDFNLEPVEWKSNSRGLSGV